MNYNDDFKFDIDNLMEEDSDYDKAILVGLQLPSSQEFEHSLEELEALCKACYIMPVFTITQSLPSPHQALYIGSGKVAEVREAAINLEADYVIFDDSLSPSQARNLKDEIGLPVMDRTSLILEIFSTRAQTKEAKLQVELAKLQYLLPRLGGMGVAMSRQGGGSGSRSNKGSGEKKLELDKRYISNRISECKREIKEVKKNRVTQRKSRLASAIPQVALVGYTNAGKSTLMNLMLTKYGNNEIADNEHKKVLQQDMLFATLDTTIRKITPEGKPAFYLSDTVGFIDKLPHHLVDAFRSTLEEALMADLILQVVDVSDEYYREQMRVTEETLRDLGASDIPMIVIYNKADRVSNFSSNLPILGQDRIHMSAASGVGLEELMDMILEALFGALEVREYVIPYDQGGLLSQLIEISNVIQQDYLPEGTYIKCELNLSQKDASLLAKLQAYLKS